MRRLNIVFGHVAGGQFLPIHRYLNESGLANSWLVCTQDTCARYPTIANLVAIEPLTARPKDTVVRTSHKAELANDWSLAIAGAIRGIACRHPIDLYVGHVIRGSPLLLFNNVDFPIVSYLEFPCFRAHGWDPRYPVPELDALADNNQEMLSWYSVLRSELAIVPSEYAKGLFPAALHEKINVIPDVGFRVGSRDSTSTLPDRRERVNHVGFAARDLSTAKGFERFVEIASAISRVREDVHFVVIGSPHTPYGFESTFLNSRYAAEDRPTFAEHVVRQHGVDRSRFTFTGLVAPAVYDSLVHTIDVFLYPLQFGSSNWGLHELLQRGAVVIASDRCYLPEVIQHDVNGCLVDYDDIAAWAALTLSLLDDHARAARIANAARTQAQRFQVELVAPRYMEVFERAVSGAAARKAVDC